MGTPLFTAFEDLPGPEDAGPGIPLWGGSGWTFVPSFEEPDFTPFARLDGSTFTGPLNATDGATVTGRITSNGPALDGNDYTTYGVVLNDVSRNPRLALGAFAGGGVVQSFSGQPLLLNPQGNAVNVGGPLNATAGATIRFSADQWALTSTDGEDRIAFVGGSDTLYRVAGTGSHVWRNSSQFVRMSLTDAGILNVGTLNATAGATVTVPSGSAFAVNRQSDGFPLISVSGESPALQAYEMVATSGVFRGNRLDSGASILYLSQNGFDRVTVTTDGRLNALAGAKVTGTTDTTGLRLGGDNYGRVNVYADSPRIFRFSEEGYAAALQLVNGVFYAENGAVIRGGVLNATAGATVTGGLSTDAVFKSLSSGGTLDVAVQSAGTRYSLDNPSGSGWRAKLYGYHGVSIATEGDANSAVDRVAVTRQGQMLVAAPGGSLPTPDGTSALQVGGDATAAGTINSDSWFKVSGVQVVGTQGAAVPDATDLATLLASFNALLARCRAHGLIET